MRAPADILDMTGLWRALLAIALGTGAGVLAASIGLPLPWMLGPMIGVAAAALLGAPIKGPDRLRPVVIPVIGVMLGSSLTVEVFDALLEWGLTVALLVPFLILMAGASYAVFRLVGRYDRVTAWFCAMPGGLNEMLIMGAAAGADERRIALAHASRVFLVIVFVALFFGLVFGVRTDGTGASWVPFADLTLLDWVILGGCAVFGLQLGTRLRLPAAQVFGPMILSGLAHITGIVTVAPPSVIVIIAQIVIGTVVGSRFLGVALSDVGRDLGLGILSTLAMLLVTLSFAYLVSDMTGIGMSLAFLAFSPGGLAEMSLLALAMGQGVAFVSVMHIVRLTLVISAAGPLFRLMRRFGL